MNRKIISLTTVPERLNQNVEDGFKSCLTSLCCQNYSDYEVHLNLPTVYKITNEKYIIPEWLNEYQKKYSHLKVYNVDDIGPATKIVPTLLRETENSLIIVVDDDLVYHEDMIVEHIKYHEKFQNSVILYDGRQIAVPKYFDLRDAWVVTVAEPLQVYLIQHYKSASYFRKYFEDDFFTSFVGKTNSDDMLLSYYCRYKKIKAYVVPYEKDIDKILNYDDWYKFQGVTTFPVIKHTNSVLNTGCNHPVALHKEPKFFIPEEFKIIEQINF